MDQIMITALTPDATDKVMALYKAAAANGSGLARAPDEIDEPYVRTFLERAQKDGVSRVAWTSGGTLAAEIHALRMIPAQFRHVLSDLTVAVHPGWQNEGLGTLLFRSLIDAARALSPPVTRIELLAREGNAGAIGLYQRAGFRIEGRLEARVRLPDGRLEDDIAMAMLL